MSRKRNKNIHNRYRVRLSKIVEEVCHFGYHVAVDCTKSYMIVKIIFEVVTKALQRGENVTIPGFGTFIVVPGWKLKKRVRFIPSEPLRKTLNEQQPEEYQDKR